MDTNAAPRDPWGTTGVPRLSGSPEDLAHRKERRAGSWTRLPAGLLGKRLESTQFSKSRASYSNAMTAAACQVRAWRPYQRDPVGLTRQQLPEAQTVCTEMPR